MHIITRKRLNEFAARRPDYAPALGRSYRPAKSGSFRSAAELRALFPDADQVGKLPVFNIAGNRARLVAAIHHNRGRIYVRAIMLHSEDDEGR